ncbi:MAG: helix-turn-helix transcriptional regulator [Gammaproteobacteria bacterium]|nr:helix-turn-helix transcriptional regulator [Gammaproteobacteria bacterium]MYF66501.1 helix-turn-helix transcriptional regulator [Gammaproteobacteria bacterium]MYK37187.1 helix-turn-helix transcriptional regulator [Gammaproteobacteria bacterium]
MSEPDAFGRILAALHESALEPAQWPRAAALIEDSLGVHGSSLACGEGESDNDYQIYFLWTCLHGERRPDLERLWLETGFPEDRSVSRYGRFPFDRTIHISEVYTEEELKTSLGYHILRTRAHAGNAINVRLKGPGASRVLWQINDPVDRDGWSSERLERVGRLQPHIRQTVRVGQTLAGAGALGATLTQLLDITGVGVIQLDARRRIVAANDRALSVLQAGDALRDKSGFLFAKAQTDDEALQAALARALTPFGNPGEGGSLTIKRSAPMPPLVLHVNPLPGREASLRGWPAAALVLLAEPARGARIDPDLAAAVLGLTPTESRVAVMLAEGIDVRDIASAMERKESTIRYHVKQIYAKHGLRRQAELVRLVLSLAGAATSGGTNSSSN